MALLINVNFSNAKVHKILFFVFFIFFYYGLFYFDLLCKTEATPSDLVAAKAKSQ